MINFEKFAQEGNHFLNKLSEELGHPNDQAQAGILLRSVLHVLRDRITIAQSFNLISELPMFLKALYVEQWKFHEKPKRIKSIEEFCQLVEGEQNKFKEHRFNWEQSTEEIIRGILSSLTMYFAPGQIEDIQAEMPTQLKELFMVPVK